MQQEFAYVHLVDSGGLTTQEEECGWSAARSDRFCFFSPHLCLSSFFFSKEKSTKNKDESWNSVQLTFGLSSGSSSSSSKGTFNSGSLSNPKKIFDLLAATHEQLYNREIIKRCKFEISSIFYCKPSFLASPSIAPLVVSICFEFRGIPSKTEVKRNLISTFRVKHASTKQKPHTVDKEVILNDVQQNRLLVFEQVSLQVVVRVARHSNRKLARSKTTHGTR